MPKLTREQLDREEADRQKRYAANVAKWGEHAAFCPPTREQRNARRRERAAFHSYNRLRPNVDSAETIARAEARWREKWAELHRIDPEWAEPIENIAY